MSAPSDQHARTRFAQELDRNFSVVASAGSGKTHAITERIVALAKSAQAQERLPQLVVVTFTNRAADEMQQRARQRLFEAGLPLEVLAAFNRAFFGTIHSFCMKLLRAHGHTLGLPGECEIVNDDTALWRAFVQQQTRIGTALPPAAKARLFRHVRVAEVMELGRNSALARHDQSPPGEVPDLDFGALFSATHNNVHSRRKITAAQKQLREWLDAVAKGEDFAPLPLADGGGAAFQAAWQAAFAPLRAWLQQAALCASAEVAAAFREFRLRRGALTYDDQVSLALALFSDAETARKIREKNYRIILDEAQDTDPEQFAVLLETARAPEAAAEAPPRPGHFCMVGDFQQSIYGQRADLARYRSVHDLVRRDGEALTFSVTFRLDQAPLDLVNAAFPLVLDGVDGQVEFVELQPRASVLPGQVLRVPIQVGDDPVWDEAEQLARWLSEAGLPALGATEWSEVAIICPRIKWFGPLRTALQRAGLAAQLQSDRTVRGDHPAVAWFTALIVALTEPENAWEIVGVLREIFGLSDEALAAYAEGNAARFSLARPAQGSGAVAETLSLLADLRTKIAGRALFRQAREIVAATQLRARLLALPASEYESLGAMLDEMLTLAAAAESEGLTLADFAARLRADFERSREARAPRPECVQIITGHKAKGLEWPVVVVPYFARKVSEVPVSYPRLYRGENGALCVAFAKADMTDETDATLTQRERQEAQRLLYVALTRARHTLVLTEDEALFSLKSGVSPRAQAHLLHAQTGGVNNLVLAPLPSEARVCAQTRQARAARLERTAAEATVRPLAAMQPPDVATAQRQAAAFLKRNPSALVASPGEDATKTAEPEARAGAGEPPGALYGTWWHALVEELDWTVPEDWDAHFAVMLAGSPDAERAQKEWALFRKAMAQRTELAGVPHAELPFLWRMNDGECLEGIIDLAIFDPERGAWLIVDWKTNRITAQETAALHERYEPQLAAYRAALRAILGAPVSAALYSTATGTWLPYEDDALERRWAALRLSAEELEAALLA
jgi:ATP-dependent exoDNAse (exonuclease V) beta subunit